jgi:enamine deaminase RidA (YjgF/YER057c/UK114 family)
MQSTASEGRREKLAETRFLNPQPLHSPVGYSHVAEVGKGRLILVSGQVALDKSGSLVGKGDIAAQAKQAFENLKTALESVGARMSDVVKLNYFIVDMSKMPELRAVREGFFQDKERMPVSTAVGVTSLAQPDFLIEIEAMAAIES